MAISNAVDATTAGVQCMTSGGVWNGRTITAGTGISVTNGDGVSGNPTISATGAASPSTMFSLYDDFMMSNSVQSAFIISSVGWRVVDDAGSQGNWSYDAATSTHPGIIIVSCNSNSGSNALINSPASSVPVKAANIAFGGGVLTYETLVKLSTLSVLNQDYYCRIGIGDIDQADVEPSNGAYFTYTRTENSGNWIGKTSNGATRTSVNSSSAASTNWVKLGITVNAAGTSVEFFIDGVSIGTSATNIPTSALGFFYQMNNTSGANTKSLSVDYISSTLAFTTPR